MGTNKENRQPYLLFDFDGTLADTFPMFVDIAMLIADEDGLDKSAVNRLHELRGLGTRKLMAELGISVYKMPSYAKKAQGIMNSRLDEIKVFSGIKKVLKALKDRGIRMAVLSSNNEENVRYVLKQNDISEFFEFIESGASLFGKDKKIKAVIKKYKLSDFDIYYFGDETRDMEGANKAKVISVGVSWGFNTKEALERFKPNYVLNKVVDILDLFK